MPRQGFQVTLNLKPGTHGVGVGAVEADGRTVDSLKSPTLTVRVH